MELTDQEKQEAREALLAGNAGYSPTRKGSGYIVECSLGKGRTFHSEDPINGKIPVFLPDGKKLLCTPEKLKFVGFID